MERRRTSTDRATRRRPGHRTPFRTVRVICEGITEAEYIDSLARDVRIAISVITVPSVGVPLKVVNRALDIVDNDDIDEVWCVFDVEAPQHHPNLNEAMRLASSHPKIGIAVSNPSFEVWLAMHFANVSSHLTTGEAVQLSVKLDPRQNPKHIDAMRYLPNRFLAASRARALDEWHAGNHTAFPENNPSSGMHRLMTTLAAELPADASR